MLTEDKFIPEVHLRQPDLSKVPADHLGKKGGMQKYKRTEGSRWVHQNELAKTYSQLYMAYEEFKSLSSRTDSTKVLGDKAFNIAQKLQSMVDSKVVFLQWFTNFFLKISATYTGSRIVYEEATKASKNKQKKKKSTQSNY